MNTNIDKLTKIRKVSWKIYQAEKSDKSFSDHNQARIKELNEYTKIVKKLRLEGRLN